METEPGAGEMEKKTKTRWRRGGRQKEIPRSGQSETRRGERSEKRRSQHPASAAVAWEVDDGSGSLGGGGRTAAGAGGVRGNGRRWGSTGTGGAFIAPPAAGPPPGRPL